MKLLTCTFCAVVLQITTAQVLTYVPRNSAPGQITTNHPTPTQQTANANVRTIQNVPKNRIPRSGSRASFIANSLANANANALAANALSEKTVNPNPSIGIVTNEEIASDTNPTLANTNLNGNMVTFNLGNGGFTVTSGSPGVQGFGIQVSADALEVSGTVAVNGQIPIYGAVSLNGQLPTDGSAAVSYTCGGPTAPDGELIN